MDTVVQPPAEVELHLLTDWSDPGASTRRKRAVLGTVLVHTLVIAALIAVPPILVEPEKPLEAPHITLLEPVTQLTQKAPNKGPISKEFESRLEAPRRALQAPVAPLATKPRPEAPRPAVIPAAPPPKPAPAPALPEPPKLETGTKEPPRPDLPAIAQNGPAPPPPQIQPAEKPKLSLEPVAPSGPVKPTGRVPIPGSSVNDAMHEVARGQGGAGIIGDPGASGSGYGGITQTPTPGTPLSNVQLLSDPQGVDFRPYLIQLLQTVKRNWMAVMPESVKLGRRGKVVIQFAIANDGKVTKLVYAQNSGSDALDRAAVAGISASNPFPPLPREFHGDRIVLQLNFVYR